MFLVSDTIETRHKFIEGILEGQYAVAGLLLAAAEFERTVRRAILGLGSSPTKHIRAAVLSHPKMKGFAGYKKAWNAEVYPRLKQHLAGDVVPHWDEVCRAFKLRNRLIHGEPRKYSSEFVRTNALAILKASRAVHELAADEKVNLDTVIRRIKART